MPRSSAAAYIVVDNIADFQPKSVSRRESTVQFSPSHTKMHLIIAYIMVVIAVSTVLGVLIYLFQK